MNMYSWNVKNDDGVLESYGIVFAETNEDAAFKLQSLPWFGSSKYTINVGIAYSDIHIQWTKD